MICQKGLIYYLVAICNSPGTLTLVEGQVSSQSFSFLGLVSPAFVHKSLRLCNA